MMDLHCHILPQMDDGPKELAETIDMAKTAVQQGITHILCTPHHNALFCNPKKRVLAKVAQIQSELQKRRIPLCLFEGQEVRIHSNLVEEIRADRILFADVTDRYLLLELPTRELPVFTDTLVYELRQLGKVPIIVHPERNQVIQENPNHLLPYLNMGCLMQLTAPSLVGLYGKKIQRLSEQLIDHHLVQMVASDAHGQGKRTFYLQAAYQIIQKKYGQNRIDRMDDVCKAVLNGEPIKAQEYTPVIE